MATGLFNALYEATPNKIFYRVCASCVESHQHIYYKRLTPIPDGYDLFNALKNKWTNANNVMGQDFNLYSTLEDALDETNAWQFCNYHQHVGMPFECGPTEKVRNQWAKMYWPGGKLDVALYMFKDDASSPTRESVNGGVDFGSPRLPGSGETIDGKSYISAAGTDIWNREDEGYFIPQSGTGSLKLTVHILSFDGTNSWGKVGLMMRETLDAGSKNAFCLQSYNNGVVFQFRPATSDWSRGSLFSNQERGGVWLQLEKAGDTYTCSWSVDGQDWSNGKSSTIQMGDDLQIGIAMTSHDQHVLADAFYEDFTVEDTTA